MVKLITVIEVCTQTTQNHQSRGQPQNKDDCEYQYAGPGEWQEGTEMQFCTDLYGPAQRCHESGHAGGTAGFYCEVGGLEEVGDVEEVLVGFGVGCGDGGGRV